MSAEELTMDSEMNHNSSKEPKVKPWRKHLRSNLLSILTIIGVFGGVGLGFILRNSKEGWTPREIHYVNFLGDLFLRMLKGLILPLIISSLIAAIGSLDMSLSRKIGGRAIVYYMATTIMAVILGIILVTTIEPGKSENNQLKKTNTTESTSGTRANGMTVDTLLDLIRNMFSPNLVQACIEQYRTVLQRIPGKDIEDWPINSEYVSGMNILGLVIFSVFLGIAIGKMGPNGKILANFFQALSECMMIITNWVIWVSPVGIMFLIATKILEIDDLSETMQQLGLYFGTVLVGLMLHGFIILPLIYFLMTRQSPLIYILNMGQALATAFGTSSSSATLPVAIGCLENKNGIDPRVSRFVMPIGATINMDGTALYEAVAALFIAQIRSSDLTFGTIVAVSITATFASIGAAGIPQAGLVTMVMVLDAIGLPAGDVSLILAVDWILDRFRTTINVLGDSLGAGIVNHLSKNELDKLPQIYQNN